MCWRQYSRNGREGNGEREETTDQNRKRRKMSIQPMEKGQDESKLTQTKQKVNAFDAAGFFYVSVKSNFCDWLKVCITFDRGMQNSLSYLHTDTTSTSLLNVYFYSLFLVVVQKIALYGSAHLLCRQAWPEVSTERSTNPGHRSRVHCRCKDGLPTPLGLFPGSPTWASEGLGKPCLDSAWVSCERHATTVSGLPEIDWPIRIHLNPSLTHCCSVYKLVTHLR